MTTCRPVLRLTCLGLSLGALVFGPSGCGGASAGGDAGALDCTSTAEVQRALLLPRCGTSGCHRAPDPAGGLDFTLAAAQLAAQLVGVPAEQCGGQTRVVPGDAEASFLVRKIADDAPACGDRMPTGGAAALAPDAIACLKTWAASLPASAAPDLGGQDMAGPTCAPGLTPCAGTCVDTTSDGQNCGTCGKTCPVACAGSACVTQCPGGTTNCGGACVSTSTDARNCGTCSKACAAGQVCSGGTCSCGPQVAFGAQLQPIFTATCAGTGCHSGAMPKAGLDLRAGKSYAALVNVKSSSCGPKLRVVPGKVDQSYLVNKLTGVGMCAGTQMPKAGASLPGSQLALVNGWICEGAPNN